jgi:hypothetical protein
MNAMSSFRVGAGASASLLADEFAELDVLSPVHWFRIRDDNDPFQLPGSPPPRRSRPVRSS